MDLLSGGPAEGNPRLSEAKAHAQLRRRRKRDPWTHCSLGSIFVVPHVERFEVVGVVDDKHGDLPTVLHQVLLVFRLEVTAPLGRQEKGPGVTLCLW